jgi:hypothetical protein
VGPGRLWEGDDLKHMPIEPNDLFDKIRFDPRLMSFERNEREKRFRELGLTVPILKDETYQKALWIVRMKN